MGKRSAFERNPRDYYPTPDEGVAPLFRFLPPACKFIEPCAGDGRLIRHLERKGHECVYACDIEPRAPKIEQRDILWFSATGLKLPPCDLIITNTPWDRDILHPMIELFRAHAPTWLLIDSDWAFTSQAVPYMRFCKYFVTVGRISWEGNGVSGKDNCSWYLFQADECETIFIPKNT